MNITQVKIFPVEEEKLKAFVSIVFDHCFMVNDIKVIQGKDGLFLSMPSRRKKSGEFKDVAHPLNNETRRHIEETVLREYRTLVDDPTPRRPDRQEEDDAPGDMAPPPRVGGSNGSSRPQTPVAAVARVEPPSSKPDSKPDSKQDPNAQPQAPSSVVAANSSDASDSNEEAAAAAGESAGSGRGDDAKAAEKTDDGDRSLEEVQEEHLRDSFWTVT